MPASCAWGDICACPARFQARALGSGPTSSKRKPAGQRPVLAHESLAAADRRALAGLSGNLRSSRPIRRAHQRVPRRCVTAHGAPRIVFPSSTRSPVRAAESSGVVVRGRHQAGQGRDVGDRDVPVGSLEYDRFDAEQEQRVALMPADNEITLIARTRRYRRCFCSV
jgi:hypothetical protein